MISVFLQTILIAFIGAIVFLAFYTLLVFIMNFIQMKKNSVRFISYNNK